MKNVWNLSWIGVLALTACGSPFVKGWRGDVDEAEERPAEEQCRAWKGHIWTGTECKAEKDTSPSDAKTPDECKQHSNSGWFGGSCKRYAELNEEECRGVEGWIFKDGACMQAISLQCESDDQHIFVEGQCLERPELTLNGATSQTIGVGATIQPIEIKAPGALLGLTKETCGGFFQIKDAKLTSGAAPAGKNSCEADLVATRDKAPSKPQHITIKIAEGFLSFCLSFTTDEARRDREPELWNTVTALKQFAQKYDCQEAAKELDGKREIALRNEAISDLRPFAGLAGLVWLDLRDNDIADVAPLAGLSKLERLHLEGNPVASNKTPANCPTGPEVTPSVRQFCQKTGRTPE